VKFKLNAYYTYLFRQALLPCLVDDMVEVLQVLGYSEVIVEEKAKK
jgi:hypothetical protein